MIINTGERPGVYSGYEASSIISRSAGGKAVGIAACVGDGQQGDVYTFTGVTAARAQLGVDNENVIKLIELALKNGASSVTLCVVGNELASADEYKTAFATLEHEQVGVVICDSDDEPIQQALRDSAMSASAARGERVAVCAMSGNAAQLTARAAALASERVVLAGPMPDGADGALSTTAVAAALAGLIAGNTDPSLPLSGAAISGLDAMSNPLTDGDVDTLVRGGVTPIECVAGELTVVRAVTTRTKTGGADDATWRELSTVLIADDVLVTLRNALRAKFARAKNLPETREAVRSQATVELEAKRAAGIIAGYGTVTAEQNDSDPSRCDLAFEFAVSHGMNRIIIGAHILV